MIIFFNTRFAPEASWFLHIGHLKIIIKNLKISKIFNGKMNLRIDDTNTYKNKNLYKKKIIKNLNFLIKKNEKKINKNIFYSSKYFFKFYQYLELILKFLKKKKIKILRKIKGGNYKEKNKILKIFNKIIYRIKYKKHYKIKYNWFLYPSYDYTHNISDKIENINYSVCGENFKKNKSIYNLILNILYNKKIKQKQIEIKNLILNNNLLSKSKLKKINKKKYIKNSKDIRIKTIKNFYIKKINKNLTKKKEKFIKLKIKNISNNKIVKINKKKNIYLTKKILINKKIFFIKKKIINLKKNLNIKKTNYIINCYKIKKKLIICKMYYHNKKKTKFIKWKNMIYINKIIIKFYKNLINKKKLILKNEKKKVLIESINNKIYKIIKIKINKIFLFPSYTNWTYKPMA